ncbi:MAG: transcription-repair coupling factor, partial [Deltaproteobacteria bacterium]
AEEEIDRDRTVDLLVRAGYARVPVVEDPGTFAVRGGVLDIFPPLYRYPVRIELFGDLVDTMRSFDPQTQRTLRDLKELYIHPVRETVRTRGADPRARILAAADAARHPSAQTRRVIEAIDAGEEFVGIETLTPAFHARMAAVAEYLPAPDRSRWIAVDPEGIARAATDELEIAATRYDERIADHRLAFPPGDFYVDADAIRAQLSAPVRRIEVRPMEYADADLPGVRIAVDDHARLRAELDKARRQKADELMAPLVTALRQWRADGWRVAIACDSARRRDQLVGLLTEYGVTVDRRDDAAIDFDALEAGGPPALVAGQLSRGFALPADRIALVTDDDIFGERRRPSPEQRAAARRARDALTGGVSDFSELTPGDLLVHQLHGVGRYRGLAQLPIGGTPIDFVHIEYVGGTLYLPVYRLNEVQRYVGVEGHKPRMDKLGGQTWEKTRKKVSREVRALAEELLQLYAQRQALEGHAFGPRDAMFDEFEATFEFEETPDQQKAIDDVLADMEAPRPMDRLVCGDVGYGKTEVAVRAALKAVLGGKQVAVLAPTTVLVEQHFLSFGRRFAGWPVRLARLSRFTPRKQQTEVVRGLADGSIDVVIGTHRLLSADVRFKDLGLIVIDEEQRFGVAHKERLRKLKTLVDTLTLTATPIPRTLHMAMVGLREISIIATPPADRRSIRTFVARPDDGVLREGIRRELARGGQVFFVCHRIGEKRGTRQRSLAEWAAHLRQLVPEARIATAHGQMDADSLERVMVAFVDHQYDILVCTTIIENGIDIPRANTMFIDRADAFGLSQLYQLRGRIGRSNRRAFCYLLVPPADKLTADAKRRLAALQRFSELGAGFHIASHDLEIRGAGDLLGAKQSGMISQVGFDQYTAILDEAVAELRGEPIARPRDPELNVEVPGWIPDDYVPDTGQRLDLYKRLSTAEDEDEIAALLDEIADRYGALPNEVRRLGELMVVKGLARRLRAVSVDLSAARLSLALADDTPLPADRVAALVGARGSAWRLTPDMRLQRELRGPERDDPIGVARAALLDLVAYGTQSR